MNFVIVRTTDSQFVRKGDRTPHGLYDRHTHRLSEAQVFERYEDADRERIIDEQEIVQPLSDMLQQLKDKI